MRGALSIEASLDPTTRALHSLCHLVPSAESPGVTVYDVAQDAGLNVAVAGRALRTLVGGKRAARRLPVGRALRYRPTEAGRRDASGVVL